MMQFWGAAAGFIGAGLCSYGAWLLAPAAGYICGGSFLLLHSFMLARLTSQPAQKKTGQ